MYNVGPDIATEGVLTLHRNENLFVEPSFVQDMGRLALERLSLTRYPDALSTRLRQALAQYHGCQKEEIYLGNGADGVLADLLGYLKTLYDTVAIQPITYPVYPYLCKRYGFQTTSLESSSPFTLIDSPNSITGKDYFHPEKHTEFLIWDNVYGHFQQTPRVPMQTNTLVKVYSFSKFFALPSIRLGYCIAPPSLIDHLLQRKDVFNVNGFAQEIALEALDNLPYFEKTAASMQEAKQFLYHGLQDLGFTGNLGEGNFLFLSHPTLDIAALSEALAQHKIYVRTFAHIPHFFRITIPPRPQGAYVLQTLQRIL